MHLVLQGDGEYLWKSSLSHATKNPRRFQRMHRAYQRSQVTNWRFILWILMQKCPQIIKQNSTACEKVLDRLQVGFNPRMRFDNIQHSSMVKRCHKTGIHTYLLSMINGTGTSVPESVFCVHVMRKHHRCSLTRTEGQPTVSTLECRRGIVLQSVDKRKQSEALGPKRKY